MKLRILLVTALLSVTACNEDGGDGNAPATPAFSVRDADGTIATAIPVSPEVPDPLTADNRPILSNGHIMFSLDAPLPGTTDTNNAPDVFIYIPFGTADEFRLASNTSGTIVGGSWKTGNAASGNVPAWPTPNSISLSGASGDYQCVAFVSDATNLAGGTDNALTDVFLATFGTTPSVVRVSESPLLHIGFSEPSHSPSARDCAVAFVTAAAADSLNDGNGVDDVYLRNYDGSLQLISRSTSGQAGNGASFSPIAVSGYVYFLSWASNLVPDDTNGSLDLFRRDTYYNTTTRVSIGNNGTEADLGLAGPGDYGKTVFPAVPYDVSDHGRYVAFLSPATNLVAGDSNGKLDAFLHDNQGNTTVRASANELSGVSGATDEGIALGNAYGYSDGSTEFYPAVAFVSDQLLTGTQSPVAGGPRDIYYRDYRSNTLRRLSHPGSGNLLYAIRPQISSGNSVVYFTAAIETEIPGTYVELFLKNVPTY